VKRIAEPSGSETTLCTERFIYGFESTSHLPGLWGAYAEYMVLHPDSRLFSIPESMPIEDACLFNAFGGGFEWGAVVPETRAGDDVVIIGPGLRAMASVVAAKEAGARNIIVVGRARNPLKIEIACEPSAGRATIPLLVRVWSAPKLTALVSGAAASDG